MRRAWLAAFGEAARRLAEAGRDAGFGGDPNRVASWLAWTRAETFTAARIPRRPAVKRVVAE